MNRDLEAEARISAEATLLGLDFEWHYYPGNPGVSLFQIIHEENGLASYVANKPIDSGGMRVIESWHSSGTAFRLILPKRLSLENCFYRMVHALVLYTARRK